MKKNPSNIKADENLVFFRTSGWFDKNKGLVNVPIHAWVYEPEQSTVRKAIFAKLIKSKYGLAATRETQKNFDERINLLISDNERNKRVSITLGGKDYVLPKSKENGHIQCTLAIPINDILIPSDKTLRFSASTPGVNSRSFMGECKIVDDIGHSVISDIDDTVKHTQVTSRKKLLENTLFKDFVAVPGMSELYREWEKDGTDFHYVSSSPWYLYSPLIEFLEKESFPQATLHLKSFRFKDKTLLNLFKKGTETKPQVIKKILNAFPERSFTLVGDSGEEDAEVYAKIAEEYSEQIKNIYIRYIDNGDIPYEKYQKVFENITEDRWKIFKLYSDLL